MSLSEINKSASNGDRSSDSGQGDESAFQRVGELHLRMDGTIVASNRKALELAGYPADFQLERRSLLDICSSLDSTSWAEMIAVLEQGGACGFDAIFVNHLGGYVTLNCLALHEVGASLVDLYLREGTGDSTFIDAALRKLEVCEAFFDTELMDINIKNTDLEYEVTSGMFEKTFSLEKGGAIGKSPKDIYPPAFADHVSSHDRSVIDRKQVTTQIDVVPYSGKHLLVQKFPIFTNGSIRGIGVFAVDVTSLKRSERRLLESKNRFSDYVDLCDDILWEADQQWEIRESNVSGASSFSGVQLRIGNNILDEIRRQMLNPDSLDGFIATLQDDRVNRAIFELRNGSRLKLGIKRSRADSFEMLASDSEVVYRGIITYLSGRQGSIQSD